MRSLSVVIPTLDEERFLPRLLESLAPLYGCRLQLIVVDGDSQDSTAAIARDAGATVLIAEPGRGQQLRAGAGAATGDLLLFLHADSVLTAEAAHTVISKLHDPDFSIGLFRLLFDSDRAIYRLYSFFSRFDSVWTNFGDQGILVCRELYDAAGGFPEQSLLEDVAFLRRAQQIADFEKFSAGVLTSARRFERFGPMRTQWRNFRFLLRYLRGADPEALAREYRGDQAPEAVDVSS